MALHNLVEDDGGDVFSPDLFLRARFLVLMITREVISFLDDSAWKDIPDVHSSHADGIDFALTPLLPLSILYAVALTCLIPYRLNCGLWIHAMPGRTRKLWRKTPEQMAHMKRHVFCRKRHSVILDKMVSGRMKRPSYLPDSPYEPYDNFKPPNLIYKTHK